MVLKVFRVIALTVLISVIIVLPAGLWNRHANNAQAVKILKLLADPERAE
jgi:hypothetical protein